MSEVEGGGTAPDTHSSGQGRRVEHLRLSAPQRIARQLTDGRTTCTGHPEKRQGRIVRQLIDDEPTRPSLEEPPD